MSRALFRKWNGLLDRILSDQLQDLLINQHIFRQFGECTRPYVGKYDGAELSQWMSQGYVAFAGTAIRRMIEWPTPKWQSISLIILLDDLKNHDALLTRDRQRRMYRRTFRKDFKRLAVKQADKDFYRITRNKRATCLSANRIERDINALKRQAEPISRLVNKVVGHTEADRRKIGKLRYKKIDGMIKLLVDTYQRYCLLIKGKTCDPLVPLDGFEVRGDLRKIWP